MHPILKSGRWLGLYVAAWVPLGWLLVKMARGAGVMAAGATALMALLCLAPYYVCRSVPLRSANWRSLAGGHLLPGIGAAGAATIIAGWGQTEATWRPAFQGVLTLVYLLSVAVHYAVAEMEAAERQEVLAQQARLEALKSQVNPHFLFNSLNSISALTGFDAEKAREMCIRLADFLRTSLRLGERVAIPFGEEMVLTRMYLDVEQVRFGEKLRVRQRIQDGCAEVQVPALLVQPLVENAVKHGIAMMAEGGEIDMEGWLDGGRLHFRIGNPFDPEAPSTGKTGIGLRNIQGRLESRYGKAARLEVRAQERWYEVELTIPVEQKR